MIQSDMRQAPPNTENRENTLVSSRFLHHNFFHSRPLNFVTRAIALTFSPM